MQRIIFCRGARQVFTSAAPRIYVHFHCSAVVLLPCKLATTKQNFCNKTWRRRERGGGFGNHFYAFADFFVDVEFPLPFCTPACLPVVPLSSLVRAPLRTISRRRRSRRHRERPVFVHRVVKRTMQCNAHKQTKFKSSSSHPLPCVPAEFSLNRWKLRRHCRHIWL